MKEYEVLFKLGAALGSNFNGTFSSARKVIQAAEKEIQTLNKTQADITAYQRQQTNIERTNAKLETYRKQLENVQAEMAQSGTASSELANRELELQQRIRSAEEAIADKNQRLSQMGAALSEAGVDVNALADEQQRLQQRTQELTEEQTRAAEEAEQFGNRSASAFELAGDALVTAGIAKGLNEIYDAYKECVNISMEFGGTMSTVEALSGANAEEMQSLTAEAKELGATTKYTANQSAEAMTYMGMAGWEATEMLDGMSGMLNLAAASGEELGLTADIVTDNLTAFKLTAADTAHFADVLAQAATNSNTSVAIMGETFSGSASIAGALGYSIEDVATAVGLMANSGVKGSVAGTALKNTFNGLLEGATLSAAAIGEVDFTALNSDGTLKSFGQTIDELRGYFDQMTEAERVNNAMAIAGQRGYNGLLAILNSTDEEYSSLRDNIYNCTGAAERMAKIRMDNLQGDVTLLDSAADGLKLTIGEMYNDELRRLAQIGAEILTGINEFCQKNPQVVKGIMGMVAGMGTALALYKGFTAAKKIMNAVSAIHNTLLLSQVAATTAATAAQTGLNAAMSANPVGFLVGGIGALTGVLLTTISSYESAIPTVEELTEKAREFDTAMDEANSKFEDTQVYISANADTADYYIDKLEEIEEATGGNVDGNEEYHNILSLLSQTVPELADYIDLETNSIEGGTEALRQHTDAYRKDAEEKARQEYINTLYEDYGDVVKEVAENKIKLTQAQLKEEQALAKAEETQNRMNKLWAEAEKLAASSGLDPSNFLTEEYYDLEIALKEYYTEAGLAADEQENLSKAIEEGEQTIAQAKEEIDTASEIINSMADSTTEAADTTVSAYDAVLEATNDVKQASEELLESYKKAYDEAYDSITGQYKIWDTAATVIPTSIQTINDAMETQISYWNNYNTDLENLSKRADDIEGLQEMLASFSDGSEESVNAVAGFAQATDEELKTAVENWKKLQEQQGDTSDGLAGLRVDMEKGLQDIADTMQEKIDAMNLSDEAQKAAEDTLKAYVDALNAGKTTAADAAAAVSAAVTAAFATGSTANVSTTEEKVYDGSVRGFRELEDMSYYASGTLSADSGLALVGEEGPELIQMSGGERVYNAGETRAIAANISGGGQTTITISPVFNVSGSASQADLEGYSDTLVSMVIDALESAGVDARRNAYA